MQVVVDRDRVDVLQFRGAGSVVGSLRLHSRCHHPVLCFLRKLLPLLRPHFPSPVDFPLRLVLGHYIQISE